MKTLSLLSWPFSRNGMSAPSATRWRSGKRAAISRHRRRGEAAWLSPPERFTAAIVLEDLASAGGGPRSSDRGVGSGPETSRIVARYVALRAILCGFPWAGATAGPAGETRRAATDDAPPVSAQPDAADARESSGVETSEAAAAAGYLSVLPVEDRERAALAAALQHAAAGDGPAVAARLADAAELAEARTHRRGAFALARSGFELAEAADPAMAARCAARLVRLAASAGDMPALDRWRRCEARLRARVVAMPPEL